MRKLTQESEGLKKPIQLEGCFFLDHLGIVQDVTNRPFDADTINMLYDRSIEKAAIRSDCTVLRPSTVLKLALQAFGIPRVKIYQIGSLIKGKLSFWSDNKIIGASIMQWKTFSERFPIHYTQGDAYLQEVFNSDTRAKKDRLTSIILYAVENV